MTRTNWKATFAMGILLAAFVAGTSPAFAQAKEDSYQWSAELVALDDASSTMTVKAMAVGDAITQAATFKPGDKVLVTWSGFEKYASAVNGVHRYERTAKADSRFTFPAEFVSFTANMYLNFKAKVPADAVTRVKNIKPGQWITATSRHGASVDAPIAAVRGYNDPETTKS